MLRRAASALALASLVVAACTQQAVTPSFVANTYDVAVDAKSSSFNLGTVAYFPGELTARPGDTVRFTSIDRGEPHTVTFGKLIDAAVAAFEKLPPNAPPGPPPPEALKLPTLIAGQPPQVSQSAAQPCFLASGEPPAKDACAKATQPELDGTQAFYNSGYLPDAAVFDVKLASSIQPGTYRFLCLLHAGVMTGKLTVVDRSQPVPAPSAVKTNGQARLDKIVAAMKPVVDAAARAPADKAFAGVLSQDAKEANGTLFGPKELTVPVGGSVTWTIFGPHTISFNVPQDAVGLLVKAPDGSWALNGKSIAPVNSAGQPPPPPPPAAGAPPPPPPTAPIPIDSGAWDGKGFRSSGIIFSFPPVLFSYKVAFTQAGTYKFVCVIHPDMEGSVKVGN